MQATNVGESVSESQLPVPGQGQAELPIKQGGEMSLSFSVRICISLVVAGLLTVAADDLHSQVSGVNQRSDWLIDGTSFVAKVEQVEDRNELRLTNGLVTRTFRLQPNCATVAIDNHVSGESLLRGVKPEAILVINGETIEVGGLTGQPNYAYLLPEWLESMKASPSALRFVDYEIHQPSERLAWKKVRHHAPDASWPPKGVHLQMNYKQPGSGSTEFGVSVHYELYDGVPVFCKWLTLSNNSGSTITVDRFTSEVLAVVEHESRVETRDGVAIPRPQTIHVETDFAFGGFVADNANRHVVHWREDPQYATQVNYLKKSPCLLVVEPTYGPAQDISPGESFTTFRTFELCFDSTERERRSLAMRKMYRVIAPWITENPLMHHMRLADVESVRKAIDDAADVGFEMIILSFGSGFNIENDDPDYMALWKEVAAYAKSKGIEIGGYSLLSSRKIGGGNDIVSPQGLTPTHGNCPALTSEWGQIYFKKLHDFFETTGFTLLEHDGPYPGDVDVTSRPPLQKGENDSRWVQWKIATDFYKWCRAHGVYVNAPDYYFLNGTNKCGMGYREVNWSLPRAMQLIHTRQNIFDGTWHKTPSMGWMFVPLSEYHGGGVAATIEPLNEHLEHYQGMLESNLGLGVQACYRGPRLFDTKVTRDMLKSQVDWFKKYRNILESDVVHGRRADGRDLDWMLHVNPKLSERGMLVVYNPTSHEISRTITVNLYFTGLAETASVSERGGSPVSIDLRRDYSIELDVTVQAGGMNWFVIE